MFILSFISWVWTMSMFATFFLSWRCAIVLKTAHIVVGRLRIDVTAEMHRFPHNLRRKSPVLRRLLNMMTSDDLQNALDDATKRQQTFPRTQRAPPLCYMDITYTPTYPTWRKPLDKIYRHVYAIDNISSRVQYPPIYKEPSRPNTIKTATLIFRNSDSTTSLSVKDRLLPLRGQMGDFHRKSEYQLKKKVLEVVLEPEIAALVHGNQSSSGSNDSLKNMASAPPLSVRLVFEKPDRRSKIIKLEYANA